MLDYSVYGPTAAGRFLVTYPTPGCNVPTTACSCGTKAQADAEAERLNREQIKREEELARDRMLRGFRIMSSDLRRL